jgi:molecular chaperone GrpE
VEKKLLTAFEALGVEQIYPQGEVFDPTTMEAVATVEAEHPEEDEVVADVFQKGYRFKGNLIRPARVRVKQYEA